MRIPFFSRVLFVLLPAVAVLSSCSTTNHLLKARPVKLTAFFEEPQKAVNTKGKLPFQKAWATDDPVVLDEGRAATKLYIAPVTMDHLRPMKKVLARQEGRWGAQRKEPEMAARLREEFIDAFQRSPRPMYQLVDAPGKNTLTLQLAITELNPTSPKGNAVLTMMKLAITPVAGIARWFTSGNMAIEGKMITSPSGRVFFQFADNEADKLSLFNARDFFPYGHAEHSMRDWAEQFEQMTRHEKGLRLRDTSAVTLKLH